MHFAKATDSTTFLFEDVHSIYLTDGTHLKGEEARALHTQVWDIFDAASEYSRTNSSSIPSDMSLLDWVVKELNGSKLSSADKDRILQVSQAWGAYVGDPVDTQSLRNFWLEGGMEGGIDIIYVRN